jgi:hypothetical protein
VINSLVKFLKQYFRSAREFDASIFRGSPEPLVKCCQRQPLALPPFIAIDITVCGA